ncbi:uncharacterized protein TNCV_284521 [Trichonephila clavipes]|uniref:Peptidase aspartic putative domain-containing protein n=1 Tax=Trichonephila clavipes TaxID=2585209 RepID=A0A8X6VGZ1_TRICX|nr:uncharacterized protein TNCV_284521 [Trichonephila clavipes]
MHVHLLQPILNLLLENLVLDFNRKQLGKKAESTFDVMELLQVLKIEIKCRESVHLLSGQGERKNLTHNSKCIRTGYEGNQKILRNRQNKIQSRTSTCEVMTWLLIEFRKQIPPPPPELDNIPQEVQLENLVLADSSDCQEKPITILIEAEYYYDAVTGKIKHLSKKLVAVETIFGWCLRGRNKENQSPLAISVIVQENLISDQLKKFWYLEVSSLIDSKNESDVSENQIMKNFESNIKYEEKAK